MTTSTVNQEVQGVYFPVSIAKLSVMSFVTFGLYEFLWAYKNWQYLKESTGKKVSPGWRAWFGLIFIYPLLKEVRQSGQSNGMTEAFPAGLLAVGWIIWTLLGRLPDPFWLISLLSFVPLLCAQSYINRLNLIINPACEINSKFTTGNWVWIVIGCLMLLLVFVGSLLPDDVKHSPHRSAVRSIRR